MPAVSYVSRRVGARPGARLVAVLALLLGAAGLVLLVWGIVDRPILAALTLLLTITFVALVFLAVTSSGHRRRLAVVGAVVLAVAVVALPIANNVADGDWRSQGLVGLVCLALAVGAARYALVTPPPTLEDALAVRHEPRVVRHPALIVNVKSGGGKAEQFDLLSVCGEHGIDTHVLERGTDLTDLARQVASSGADVIGMAGGDGSLAYVAAVCVERDLPFVCVPAGTRNHFALDLGLDRTDPRQAIAAFVNGEERRIDYATINDRMFLNNVSLGVYAAIVAQDSYRDAKLDTTLQLLPKLVSEGGPWFDLHFDVPDHGHLDQAPLLQVSNNPYVVGADFGRRTRLDTGELGVMTVDPKRVSDLVGLTVLAAAGQAERSSALWVWSTPSFTVESGQASLEAGLDGETVSLETPLRFELVPAGLRVLVPKGTRVGLDEQNLRQTKGTIAGLLSVALGLSDTDGDGVPDD
jgi:diacylglycerol kinase family enzyme